MRSGLRRSLAAGLEGLRKVGFLLALVAGSAALGMAIAWPLWLFATSARQAYTITILSVAAVGIVFLAVRAAQKRRKARRDSGTTGPGFLSSILTVLLVLVGISGAYLAAALVVRRAWAIGAGVIVAWAGFLWLIGRARGAANARKPRSIPAENGSK